MKAIKISTYPLDSGSTNVPVYNVQGTDYLVSTNSEINEIAFYRLKI